MVNETGDTPQPPSEAELRRVALDNIRDNKLGGQNDGVDAIKVGEDLGFITSPEGVAEARQRGLETIASATEASAHETWPDESTSRTGVEGAAEAKGRLSRIEPDAPSSKIFKASQAHKEREQGHN